MKSSISVGSSFGWRSLILLLWFVSQSAAAHAATAGIRIIHVSLRPDGKLHISHGASTNAYYILFRGQEITSLQQPVDVKIGTNMTGTLLDASPMRTRAFYRVQEVPLDNPLDVDGDGIDDVYELRHAAFLNPLDPSDARLDFDKDGRSNLQEYFAGTDPAVATGPAPAAPVLKSVPTATRQSTVTIQGTAAPKSFVSIVGGDAIGAGVAGADGTFALTVSLRPNALNRLQVTAADAQGQTSPAVAAPVLQDQQPPSLFIELPADGSELAADSVTVAGRVGDLLSGFMGLSATVSNLTQGASFSTPAGGPANVAVGVGNNGTFERSNVPLVLGTNLLIVTATDSLGNAISSQVVVKRSAPSGDRLLVLSGDRQSAPAHQRVPLPLAVKVVHADGSPFTNKLVNFEVTRSDGRLLPVDPAAAAADFASRPEASASGAGLLQLLTDAQGTAKVFWTLGSDAGCANNRVTVSSRDIAGTTVFCASAQPAPPGQINIGSGNHQRGETGSGAPESLSVWVNDGCNGAPGIPVTFRVLQGGGKVNGQDIAQIQTDQTGHAAASFILGATPGNNLVDANFADNPTQPATFTVTGLSRNLSIPTSFQGVVLSGAGQPIGGAVCTLSVGGVTQKTSSDVNGQFAFSRVPAGPGQLNVDGTAASSLGTTNSVSTNAFPSLTFATALIPNAANSLGKPVVLTQRNAKNSQLYNGTQDLTLTCDGVAGLKITIKANSMRHSNGQLVSPQAPALVSLNPVRPDGLPQPLPDGAAPPLAWALEPGDARFDVLPQVEYPNVSGLPAGAQTFFLSFSPQTQRFEITGTGHVDSTGTKIVSDLGSGFGNSTTLPSNLRVRGKAGPGGLPNDPALGATCPPYPATGDAEGCVVKITGRTLVEVSKSITLTASQSPVSWSYESLGGDVTLDEQDSTVRVTGKAEGPVRIIAEFNDGATTCKGEYRVNVSQCGEDSIPLPAPFGVQGGGWSLGGLVDPDTGLSVVGVQLEGKPFADHMNIPYIIVSLNLGNGQNFQKQVLLRADGQEASGRCRLVGFHQDGSGAQAQVVARYLIDRLPDDSSKAKLCIVQRYIFRQYDPDDHCNPFAATCSRFYPIAHYDFYDDPDSQVTLDKVIIPQSIQFTIGGPANVGTFTTELVPPVLPIGGNPLQAEASFAAVISGDTGQVDNYHQTYLDEVALPTPLDPTAGCHECLHIHWRWGAIAGYLGQFFGGFFAADGFPMIPPNSHQSVTVGLTLYHPSTELRPNVWQDLIDGDYLGVPQQILFWYEGSSSEASDSFFQHGGFFVQEEPPPHVAKVPGERTASPTPNANSPGAYVLSPDSPLVALAPKRYGVLDESWTIFALGQSVQADPDGGFRLPNLAAPDVFGADGAGSPPDHLSDDLIRIKGISTRNGVNRYLRSEFFQIPDDGKVFLKDIQISLTPPFGPDRLDASVDSPSLTQINQQSHFRVVAEYPDGSQKDVTSRALGTTYRTSNPKIAKVNAAGVLTAIGRGTAYLTAVNEGVPSVVQVDVVPGQPVTTVIGLVQDSSGNPVAGAEVTLTGLAARAVTGPDGRFTVSAVPVSNPSLSLTAQFFNGTDRLQAIVSNVPLVPSGVTDMGLLRLRAAPQLVLPRLATGESHTVVIEADGSLWAWGDNSEGQLGDSASAGGMRLRPVRIGTDSDWVTVTAGQESTAAIKRDGTLWAWGSGQRGQLGQPDKPDRLLVPTQIGGDRDWVSVEAGDDYLLAVKADGSLWGWGANDFGQLGAGTTTDAPVPIQIGTARDWKSVSAGLSDDGSCALKQDGTLWAWGFGNNTKIPSQLGSDTDWIAAEAREGPPGGGQGLFLKSTGTLWTLTITGQQRLPTFIQYGTDSDWTAISAADHSALLLKSDGSLWAYGFTGILGDGTYQEGRTPLLSPVQVGPGLHFSAAATLFNHSVALSTDGVFFTWGGENQSGELGLGFTQTAQAEPLQIGSDADWAAVTFGNFAGAALKQNGTLWTWGWGEFGQIGDGQLLYRAEPTRVPSQNPGTSVSVGNSHILALQGNGTVWAWGQTSQGALGIPNLKVDPLPTPTLVGQDQDWVYVDAIGDSSFAIKRDGSLWAWGANSAGQLGLGSTSQSPIQTPTRIGTDLDWQAVFGTPTTSYAIKNNGSLWAWGVNGGLFGDGSKNDRLSPAPVGSDRDWVLGSASAFIRVALKKDGGLWGWGFDAWLGVGSGSTITFPRPLGAPQTFVSVGVGEQTLAVARDGTLWTGGSNSYGELGTGTRSDQAGVFRQARPETDWKVVAAGPGNQSAGIKTDGTLWTWGNYGLGLLGNAQLLLPRRVGNAAEWGKLP